MKRVIIIALLLSIFGSCNKEEPSYNNDAQVAVRTLSIVAQMPTEPATRLYLQENAEGNINVKWKEGDKLNLCFVAHNGGTVKTVNDIPIIGISEEGKKGKFTIPIPPAIEGRFDLYGIYGASFEEADSKVVLLPNSLVESGSLEGAQDIVVLKFAALDIDDQSTPSVSFSHIGSIIGVWLTNSTQTAQEISSLAIESDGGEFDWIENGTGAAELDITTNTFVERDSGSSLTILDLNGPPITIPVGESLKFYRWFVPTTSYQPGHELQVLIDEAAMAEEIPAIEMTAGLYYRLKLEKSDAGWGRLQPQPNSFYFTVPDFSESEVYKVLYNGTQVAEVAREYLKMSTTHHDKAIVAYPMVDDGGVLTADLTKGYVTEMLATVNNNGDVGPAAIRHGGSVSFDKASNTILANGYSRGTLTSPITTVYIGEDGSLSKDEIAGSVEATVVPDIITDIRGDETNIYPIVKIATQYWMAKNLNTGKYNSNLSFQNIPTNVSSATWAGYLNNKEFAPIAALAGAGLNYYDINNALAISKESRDSYGVLYTYAAINGSVISPSSFDLNGDIIDNISPEGWIVPSKAELQSLFNYVAYTKRLRQFLDSEGNPRNISGKLDENISGFSARDASYRAGAAAWQSPGINSAFFWSRTNGATAEMAWFLNLIDLYEQSYMRAMSIRCIRK
ncbi:MAG: FISUMP domain-containing protein [Bacteroidales bacterium]